ncbi:MAG: hypothetical protein RMK89_07065, partial [Armatimonadota bacterium]|nr:hypothetical protein [Armatimonadota bacterium]MDW8143205.1 hypothetical protein [Armatimonadota bacterium]
KKPQQASNGQNASSITSQIVSSAHYRIQPPQILGCGQGNQQLGKWASLQAQKQKVQITALNAHRIGC